MSRDEQKVIGFLIGREQELPEAVMQLVNQENDDVRAEMVSLGPTFLDDPVPYDVIIDRMSHEIPFYRNYVKYAVFMGCYLINNPYIWSFDSRFLSAVIARKQGWNIPRTLVLPNKDVAADVVPDSFRNLKYPMDWQGVIDYIGGPAIFKDVLSGGRRFAHRVHSVEELIQHYDESGTRTMILQEVIESERHVHCLVVGGEATLLLPYSFGEGRYYEDAWANADSPLTREIVEAALKLTRLYGYEINMPEFVVVDGRVYVINVTNPSPLVNHDLMTDAQFDWIARATADLAVKRARNPLPQPVPLYFED